MKNRSIKATKEGRLYIELEDLLKSEEVRKTIAEMMESDIVKDSALREKKKEFELEIGKDYIHVDGNYLILNRVGDEDNSGFYNDEDYDTGLCCATPKEWREATKEQVIEFFEKHLIERYGEDWKNVKIKDSIHKYNVHINNGEDFPDINKYCGIWWVWNNNGCLFNGKEWAEEKKVATDLSEIDRPYYISSIGNTAKNIEMQDKNHMTSIELCEGILALQQLISFRDDFHEVHGGVTDSAEGAICLSYEKDGSFDFSALYIHLSNDGVSLFEFETFQQAKEFLVTHKDLFKELKKLY